MPDTPEHNGYWETVAGRFEDQPHHLDDFLGRIKRQAYLDLIARWGGVPQAGRVLKTDLFEEASGPDLFLPDLAADGVELWGMDISADMASRANKRLASPDLRVVTADARCLPFDDESFDLVISPSTLDHFPDHADLGRSLREIRRVLKPGGRLILTLDNRQNVTDWMLRLAYRLRLTPFFLGRSYSVHEVREELAAAGMAVRETTAIIHNPRLFAVGAIRVARMTRIPFLMRLVQRWLLWMQRFDRSRWRYRTGCFVAALAMRAEG